MGAGLEAYVLAFRDGEIHLTTRLSRREQSRSAIHDAFVAGVPVEGRVAGVIKGGFEVRVSDFRAFCPLSQIDLRWPKEPELHVGQIYPFKVIEYKDKGRNIIVSRRALIEADMVTRRDEIKKRIAVGEVVTGRVRNVQSFGAFVELGGVDGLIPVSEMAWERVEDPKAILSEGQEVTVKVIGVDWEKERISLSIKALAGDPWAGVADRFPVGSKVRGKVERITNFGAFIALEPGIDGMIHVSALGVERRAKHPKDILSVGEEVEAQVVAVEPEKHRISLSMEYKYLEGLGALPRSGEIIRGTVEKIVDFGVFLRLPSGHLGLIPNAEMNTKKGTDHSQMLRPGDEMDVKVLEIEDGGKKIRLSVRALVRDRERQVQNEYEAYKASENQSFGTFGDLLRAKKG
ncbi:S1 RNA-binding domain-containing protein [bacterium]|nr:MAG: S1 RNA-binding domain-containing protein [bacterium]